jgi:hypothetical protein
VRAEHALEGDSLDEGRDHDVAGSLAEGVEAGDFGEATE